MEKFTDEQIERAILFLKGRCSTLLLNETKMAKKIGTSQAYYNKIINKKAPMTPNFISKVATVFNVEPAEIFNEPQFKNKPENNTIHTAFQIHGAVIQREKQRQLMALGRRKTVQPHHLKF